MTDCKKLFKTITNMLYVNNVITERGYIIHFNDYIQLKSLTVDKQFILNLKVYKDKSYEFEFEVIT